MTKTHTPTLSALLTLTALLALVGCVNPDDSGNKDSESCTSNCDSDTDTADPPQGSATITLDVYELADIVAAPIILTGHNDYTITSHVAATVAAPDSYTATVGDASLSDQFGFPVYQDEALLYWAASPLDLGQVDDGGTLTDSLDLFELFEPGEYNCTHSNWVYSESAPDHKGEQHLKDVALEPQQISMDADGTVQTDSAGGMSIMSDNAHLYGVGNGFAIEDPNDLTIMLDSTISPDGFWVSVETAAVGSVDDLNCQK